MFQIVSEFQKNGMDFILKAINLPTYLEDLTGLTELKKSANSFEVDWDIEDDIDEDECVEIWRPGSHRLSLYIAKQGAIPLERKAKSLLF